jgi:hypothetical protein
MISSIYDFKIQKLIKNIKNPSAATRAQAFEEIAELDVKSISEEMGKYILREAAKGCPASEIWTQDVSNILVTFIAENPREAYIPVIEEIFASLSVWSKPSVLRLLSLVPTEESAKAYLRILEKHHKTSEFDQLPIEYEPENEVVAKTLFPELLTYITHPDLVYYVLSYANGCLEAGTLSQETMAPYVTELRQLFWRYEKQYEQDLIGLGDEANWDEETQDLRDLLGMFLDVLGDIENEEIEAFMKETIKHPDKKFSFFAVLSMLRKNIPVEQADLDALMNDLEMRSWFYDELEAMKKLHIVSPETLTKEKMAEGAMVRWLSYPTELGHVPSDIELMGTIEKETCTYYLYRFASEHPQWDEMGYMAGISGPFDANGKPVPDEMPCTFSAFEAWDEKTLDEHAQTIFEIVRVYWEHQKKEKQ